jgi:hypothetical protein
MTDAVETNLGRKPEQLSADAGYCSEANLEALETREIDGYVATGRTRDAVAGHLKGGGCPETDSSWASDGSKKQSFVTAQEVCLEALRRITPYGENLSGLAGLGR